MKKNEIFYEIFMKTRHSYQVSATVIPNLLEDLSRIKPQQLNYIPKEIPTFAEMTSFPQNSPTPKT